MNAARKILARFFEPMATELRTVPIRLRQTPTTYRDAAAILPAAVLRHKPRYDILANAN